MPPPTLKLPARPPAAKKPRSGSLRPKLTAPVRQRKTDADAAPPAGGDRPEQKSAAGKRRPAENRPRQGAAARPGPRPAGLRTTARTKPRDTPRTTARAEGSTERRAAAPPRPRAKTPSPPPHGGARPRREPARDETPRRSANRTESNPEAADAPSRPVPIERGKLGVGAPAASAKQRFYAEAKSVPGTRHRAAAAAAAPVPGANGAAPTPGGRELPRLSKLMAERGLCSRREADEWIENGWVRVDGKAITVLGTRVHPNAVIEIGDAARKHQSETVTVLLNKPLGFVSGQAEDDHQPASVLVRPENRWSEDTLPRVFKAGHLRSLAPAGRLDIDSTGLLVLTQDGRIARKLVGDDSEVEKEYLVRVEGELSDAGLAQLRHGLTLDDVRLKPTKVSWQNEQQLRFVLREGRKRQIRRMCELVGLKVVGLKRVRIGSVTLGKLPVGKWRYLRPDEQF